jgi:hypothetical protein
MLRPVHVRARAFHIGGTCLIVFNWALLRRMFLQTMSKRSVKSLMRPSKEAFAIIVIESRACTCVPQGATVHWRVRDIGSIYPDVGANKASVLTKCRNWRRYGLRRQRFEARGGPITH